MTESEIRAAAEEVERRYADRLYGIPTAEIEAAIREHLYPQPSGDLLAAYLRGRLEAFEDAVKLARRAEANDRYASQGITDWVVGEPVPVVRPTVTEIMAQAEDDLCKEQELAAASYRRGLKDAERVVRMFKPPAGGDRLNQTLTAIMAEIQRLVPVAKDEK